MTHDWEPVSEGPDSCGWVWRCKTCDLRVVCLEPGDYYLHWYLSQVNVMSCEKALVFNIHVS